MTKTELYEFILTCRYGVLGTISSTGTPQSALVGIAVTPQLEIVFDTVRRSRKYANLVARPACSFVIGGWGPGEQTVQFEGEAEELKWPALERHRAVYFGAWPDGPERMHWPGSVYFLVRPKWIRYSDFDRQPPAIHEFDFPAGIGIES